MIPFIYFITVAYRIFHLNNYYKNNFILPVGLISLKNQNIICISPSEALKLENVVTKTNHYNCDKKRPTN